MPGDPSFSSGTEYSAVRQTQNLSVSQLCLIHPDHRPALMILGRDFVLRTPFDRIFIPNIELIRICSECISLFKHNIPSLGLKVPLKVPGSSTTRLTKIWPPSTACPQSPSSLVLYRGRFHCLSSFLLSLWGVLYAVWIHLSPLMENNCKANKSSLPHWAGPYSWGSAVR